MIESDMQVVLAMLLYFVVVVVIGFVYAKRSNSSSEEYFLGGRGLGPWLTALSAEASDMSGWLLMGLPGVAYFTGASDAMWTAIGLAIGTYLNWKFVAKRLRKYSEKAGNAITVPDFFSNRFHDTKHILMTIAAVIILLFFTIYTASCFVTVGKLFATLFGWDYGVMMVIGAIIVFLYTFMGGYLSVCTTDLIQGMLMFFALATVFIGSVTAAGRRGKHRRLPAEHPRLPLRHRNRHAFARRGGQPAHRGQRAYVRPGRHLRHHHHRERPGLGPRLLRHAPGAHPLHVHPPLRRDQKVAYHRHDLARGVPVLGGVHRPYRPRGHPDRVPHPVGGRVGVHRAVEDAAAELLLRARGLGYLRGGYELLFQLPAHLRAVPWPPISSRASSSAMPPTTRS